MSCDQGWSLVSKLTQAFSDGYRTFKSKNYDEAKLRQGFIDPLFEALGWDVEASARSVGADVEVVFEDRDGTGRRPDYGFYGLGRLQYFLEVKKPAQSIEDKTVVYQAKEYAWNAKAPFCLVTNFEHCSAYLGNTPPHLDQPTTGRIAALNLGWEDYGDKWQHIWDSLSRTAVLQGSVDKVTQFALSKKYTTTVDTEFLNALESWRVAIGAELYISNKNLQCATITEAVERILDRIVFLRVCEDRGVARGKPQLQAWRDWTEKGGNLHEKLLVVYRRLDLDFNGGLFAAYDTDKLALKDSHVLGSIFEEFYATSAYRFDIMPVEILGSVYERFLGHVLTIDDQDRVVAEAKPEVRHARGVYYTPGYIVRAITDKTLSAMTQRADPSRLMRLRVLDPACGSGSFLLAAFQHLIDAHLAYYASHPQERPASHVYEHKEQLFLTLRRKRDIIEQCLFGVDKDHQAVQIARLSLCVKLLEGESEQSFSRKETLEMFPADKYLPTLKRSIVCGNSLISPQNIAQAATDQDADALALMLNAFDWSSTNEGFGAVMKAGGFDAVIGNPPYVRIQELQKWAKEETIVLKATSKLAAVKSFDLYILFIARSFEVLNATGRVGLIVPHRFFAAQYGKILRDFLNRTGAVDEVVDFGHWQVFEGVSTYTCLLFLGKDNKGPVKLRNVSQAASLPAALSKALTDAPSMVGREALGHKAWYFRSGGGDLVERLRAAPRQVGSLLDGGAFQGLISGKDPVYFLHERDGVIFSKALDSEVELEHDLLHVLLKGSAHVRRYNPDVSPLRALFPYRDGKLIPATEMQERFALTWDYLLRCKKILNDRENGKWKGRKDWYAYGRSQALTKMAFPKILTPSISLKPSFMVDTQGEYFFVGSGQGGGGGYALMLSQEGKRFGLMAIAAYLNSAFIDWYVQKVGQPYSGGYNTYNSDLIENIPWFGFGHESLLQEISKLYSRNCALHLKLRSVATDDEVTRIRRVIVENERQVDLHIFSMANMSQSEQEMVIEASVSSG